MPIPIIDIFAGPGGLGEGFSSLMDEHGGRVFKIGLSIEKDPHAHQTLKLRSFFRQFPVGEAPEDYYNFVKGKLSLDQLYSNWPVQAMLADEEAWCGTLGTPDKKDTNAISNDDVDDRIRIALDGRSDWVLIGGPPCQAYSLAGRSRRQEKILDESKDKRVGLYKEYLRIIAVHNPAIFVMENVKGLLSAKTEEDSIFPRILKDLSDPLGAYKSEEEPPIEIFRHAKYKIYSLAATPRSIDIFGNPEYYPEDFIIKAENYGIPQKRHRVILLGIREDIQTPGPILQKQKEISLVSVIGNLPSLRSGISREFSHSLMKMTDDGEEKKQRVYKKVVDSTDEWNRRIKDFRLELDEWFGITDISNEDFPSSVGKEFWKRKRHDLSSNHPLKHWFLDERLNGVLHHVSRKHLVQDIKRYLFAARYTEQYGAFPRLDDYRDAGNDLLPDHENAESGKFTDRFRVQLPDRPATTVTSHISKDGHYFIHYDPRQARSLTLREAARVQTFPDNYYFCGGRTQQFHQVGNAVPPFLAFQISSVVYDIINQSRIQIISQLNDQNHGEPVA